MNPGLLAASAFVLTGSYAIWSDATRRLLPNALCLLVALLGLAVSFGAGGWDLAGSGLLHGLAALVVGVLLFAVGLIGGGDAKYYAAVATWFPLSQGAKLLGWVSCTGLVLFLGWFLVRRLRGAKIRRGSTRDADKFPYGVAIAIGGALLLVMNR